MVLTSLQKRLLHVAQLIYRFPDKEQDYLPDGTLDANLQVDLGNVEAFAPNLCPKEFGASFNMINRCKGLNHQG
jgi:hypothetical protein